MSEEEGGRFEVVVEEDVPRGGLYELEQTTHFHVVDRRAQRIVMTFEGKMEASLSTDTGTWDEYRLSGVSEVRIAADEGAAVVKYWDEREEAVPLPQ